MTAGGICAHVLYAQAAQAIDQLLPGLAAILISTYDATQQRITCAYALDDGQPIDVQQLPPVALGAGPQSESIRTRQVLIVNDLLSRMRELPMVTTGDPVLPHSALLAPMVTTDGVLGVMQVQSYELNHFTSDEAEVLAAIANTTAVAIQNAQLFAETRRRVDEAATLFRISTIAASALPSDELLRKLMAEFRSPFVPGLPRFTGGAVGFIGYDDEMWRSIRARRPLLVERPDVAAARAFASIADSLLALDTARKAGIGA